MCASKKENVKEKFKEERENEKEYQIKNAKENSSKKEK